ncbi:unnamed protein product, partial [Prorocentrum cordatum]
MSAQSQQFKEEMESAWARKDENFDPELIFGKVGYQFVLSHAIRSSTHPLVTGVTLVAAVAPLTNGANVKTFPGSPTQLNVVAEIGDCLGAKILAKLEAVVAEELEARNRPVGIGGPGAQPKVSLVWLGNVHPEIAAPLGRGALGSHAGATKERMFFYTGRPARAELDVDMAVLSGMEELIGGPEAAGQAQLPRARPHADEAPEEGGDRSVRCRPDAEGFLFALPDGVPSRLRYCWANDEWVAEYRIGNKSIPLPPSHEITAAAERVPTLFSKAGGTVTLSEAAAKLMRSVSTFASVKASLAVEEGDNVTSARWGIAPWKASVLTGLLFAVDAFVGQAPAARPDPAGALVAARGQVERAKRLLALLEGAREQWLDATDERRAKSVLRMSQQSAEFLAGLPAGFGLEQGQPSGLAGAEPSGAPAATARPPTKRARAQSAEPPASAQSSRPAASRADAVAGGADRGARGAALFAPLEGQAIAPGAQTQGAPPSALPAPPGALPSAPVCPRHAEAPPSATEPKQVADGAPMSRGCGPRGGTVQAFAEGQGEAWKTDRDIVRYTSQRGVVKCSEICGNLRREVMVNGRKKHLGLPQKVWEDVMAAALAQHPVGDLLEAGAPRSRVKWHAPPSAEAGREAMVKWRNLLVDMCRLTGREVRVLLQRARAPAASGSYLQLRLSAPVEHVIQAIWPQLQTHLRNLRRRRAEIDGEVSKVVKLTRKCCGPMYGGCARDPNLGKVCLHPCSAPTRGQRERWCTCRARLLEKPVPFEGAKDAGVFLVRRRECLGGALDDVLCATSQRQGVGAVRVVDDIEGCWGAAQSTLVRRAADAAKDAAESRASEGAPDKLKAKLPQPQKKRRLPAGLRTAASRGDGARSSASRGDGSAGRAARATAAQPAQPVDPAEAPPAVDASLRELEQISCNTHKSFAKGGKRGKLESASLAVRRTGGFLVACSPSGHIIDVEEFFGVESLAQRYCFLARLKKRFPALNVVIHDDACVPQWRCFVGIVAFCPRYCNV